MITPAASCEAAGFLLSNRCFARFAQNRGGIPKGKTATYEDKMT